MKRLLYVSSIFPPMAAGGAPRSGQFAKYLPQFGWAPTVLTVQADPKTSIDNAALDAMPDEVEVVRAFSPLSKVAVRGAPNPRGGLAGVRRVVGRSLLQFCLPPDRYLAWYPQAVKAGKRALANKPHDAVFATYTPGSNLIIGARLARWAGLPLVVEFRDLWGDDPMASFVTPAHRKYCQWLERRIVRQAAKVVAVSEGMARRLADRHGRDPSDVASIPNGFDPACAPLARDDRPAGPRPFRLCYTGSVDKHHDLGPFFRALRRLLDDGSVTPETMRVQFVGNLSPQEPARWGVESLVEVEPTRAHREVFDVLAGADALFVLEAPGYWAEFSYSAKIFDYLLTGKPVLALIEEQGNSARLLAAAGVGRIAQPHKIDEIAAAIVGLLSLKGAAPRPVDIEQPPYRGFNRRHLTQKLAAVLDEAMESRQEPSKSSLAKVH
jgi:glycosyltransferase involved in cell wall biosynthesis